MNMLKVRKLYEGIKAGRLAEVRKILRANPKLLEHYGIGLGTWLHQAVSTDNVEMVKMLVEEGIDVNSSRKNNPDTPLNESARKGTVKVARWLLNHGAKVDNQGGRRGTTLICAVSGGSISMVKLLLNYVDDVNVTYGKFPQNALSHALIHGHHEIAKLLRAHGAIEPNSKTLLKPTSIRDAIITHMMKHIGPVAPQQLIEIVPSAVPVTIHIIPPGKGRNYITLFTTGMSDRSMTGPKRTQEYHFAELLIRLPKDWPLTSKALKNSNNYWPIEWMRKIAYYPHENNTWLGGPYSIVANGKPPEPFSPNTSLSCMLLLTEDTKFGRLKVKNGRSIHFYTMVPLYSEERNLELKKGISHLLKLFGANEIQTVVDIDRRNVAKRGQRSLTHTQAK